MKKRITGLFALLLITMLASVTALASSRYTSKVTQAVYVNGKGLAVTARTTGGIDNVILQVSPDKKFKKNVITLSTKGRKTYDLGVGKDDDGRTLGYIVSGKTGLEMTTRTISSDSSEHVESEAVWKKSGNLKSGYMYLLYESDTNTTVYSFTVVEKTPWKGSTLYVRLKAGLGTKWGSYSAKKKVTITSAPASQESTQSLSVTNVSNKKLTLAKGKTKTLKVKVTPSSLSSKTTFATSNKKIATVDKNGKIKAVKKGTAKITVKNGSKRVTITVTVK